LNINMMSTQGILTGSVASVEFETFFIESETLLDALSHEFCKVCVSTLIWFLSAELSLLNDPNVFYS